MSAGDQVLECLSHFMTSDEGVWKAKDLKDLASLQATCRSNRAICERVARTRMPIAHAHRALIEDLQGNFKDRMLYSDFKVNYVRDIRRDEGYRYWRHPFTLSWHPVELRILDQVVIQG